MSAESNKVQCNDGNYDRTNGAVAPCLNGGGVKIITKKSMTLTHIGLFVGGLALGYFAYKKFKK